MPKGVYIPIFKKIHFLVDPLQPQGVAEIVLNPNRKIKEAIEEDLCSSNTKQNPTQIQNVMQLQQIMNQNELEH